MSFRSPILTTEELEEAMEMLAEQAKDLFAEIELEASADGIKDPGPEKYNSDREDEKRKLMQQMAFYAEEGQTWDPEGKYLCGTCYYRQLMDWGDTPACYIVSGEISMETGSCQFYKHGSPDSEWNPLPMKHRYTPAEAAYAERPKVKGFGCYPRCEYGAVAEGQDKDGREIWCRQFGVHVRAKACCAFEDGKDLVQIEAGGPGSGCDPDTAESHGTKCGPKAGPAKPASFYMHEKMGGPQGTNPGGMYRDQNGNFNYIKLYGDGKQARGEYLANQVYKELGHNVPDSQLFQKDGKDAIANAQLQGKTVQQMGAMSPEQAKQFMNGFAADVLTANWDAVGMGKDNVFVGGKTNQVYRLDQGGSFLKRAKGGDKPEVLLNQITEMDNFFKKNPDYASVAATAGVKSPNDLGDKSGTNSLMSQVSEITALRGQYGTWQNFVNLKLPDAPVQERQQIAGMLEARTNLLVTAAMEQSKTPQSSGLNPPQPTPSSAQPSQQTPDDGGKKYQPRTWGDPNPKLVGGYFRQGTVLASVYSTLSAKQGEWQSVSKIKTDLEQKLGKSLYNISQNTLKQGGKKTGLWTLEISGDNVRIFINQPGTKPQDQNDVNVDKQKIAGDFAKKMLSSMPGPGYSQSSAFAGLFNQMGVSVESRTALESAIKSWTGTADSREAQNWREVAMNFYGRKPDGDFVSFGSKVMGTPMGAQKAKVMEPAAMAMKAYAGEYAKINNLNVVYRNVSGDQAKAIVDAMRQAKATGQTQIKISLNSLSCWSDRPDLSLSSGIKLRMNIDPDNVWAAHNSSPYLFTAHSNEHEFMIGSHQAQEIFDLKNVSVDSKYEAKVTQEEYNEWHKEFKKGVAAMVDKLNPKNDPQFYKALKKAQKESKIPIANCVLDDHWMYKKDEKK